MERVTGQILFSQDTGEACLTDTATAPINTILRPFPAISTYITADTFLTVWTDANLLLFPRSALPHAATH